MKIWFGDHKGKEVSELPDNYLKWLAETASPPKARKHAPKAERVELRRKWLDLLSEVEDEISERETEDHSA